MSEQRERPIIFSGPMVRAILDGSKTQTRRVVKPQPPDHLPIPFVYKDQCQWVSHQDDMRDTVSTFRCPYGKPGDRLWLRENFCHCYAGADAYQIIYSNGDRQTFSAQTGAADENLEWLERGMDAHGEQNRPSIHMPRWASRITLEITGVRVERLQDITENDAKAEGIENIGGGASCSPWRNYRIGEPDEMSCHCSTPERSFMTLWESINGPGSWSADPWVWVIEFRRVQ